MNGTPLFFSLLEPGAFIGVGCLWLIPYFDCRNAWTWYLAKMSFYEHCVCYVRFITSFTAIITTIPAFVTFALVELQATSTRVFLETNNGRLAFYLEKGYRYGYSILNPSP